MNLFAEFVTKILGENAKLKAIDKNKMLEQNLDILKILAEKYVSETITFDKPELDQDDYKYFYELLKENNIEVENDYATEVPYEVRTVLYEAYIKIYNELIEPNEIEIVKQQEKAIQAEELKKIEETRKIFNNFANTIKPYTTNYIKTFLSKDTLPAVINKKFEEDEISAFAYLIENEYNIEIPVLKEISYDTSYLSENILQSIRNIPAKYYITNKQENKLCLIDIILSYNYALEIYNIFEKKLATAGTDLKNLIHIYISLFNENLTYVDLLLEYLQKYNIEIPPPKEEDTIEIDKVINVYNEFLRDNIIVNSAIKNKVIYLEDIMDCSDINWKYICLLRLVIKELEMSNIKTKAKSIAVKILNESVKDIYNK